MNKVIPVLSIIFAALCAVSSVIGLILCCVSVSVSQFALVSVPAAIVGAVASAVGVGFNLLFRKSLLCRIALYICVGALAFSATAITIWLCAL